MKQVNLRPFISLSVAAGFLALGVTGLLLYFLKHSNTTAAIHTSIGAVFLVVAALHIRNNFRSLRTYSYKADDKRLAVFGVKKELLLSLIPAALIVAGLLYEVPGFSAVYDWGNAWRNKQENKEESIHIYQTVETNLKEGRGTILELDVKKGKAFEYPLFAVWIEDPEGHFLQTLYVSRVIGSSRFTYGKKEGDKWVPDIVRRPEALPYWGHQRGIKARDGYFLPDPDAPLPDVITGATPTENFRLRTKTDAPVTAFKIYLEVNQSFDWNDYYAETRFPEDKIYSGSGKNGQPSVIYAAAIDLAQGAQYHALNAVGHGHHSGQDGQLYTDMANLTTALDIVDGVMVKVIR